MFKLWKSSWLQDEDSYWRESTSSNHVSNKNDGSSPLLTSEQETVPGSSAVPPQLDLAELEPKLRAASVDLEGPPPKKRRLDAENCKGDRRTGIVSVLDRSEDVLTRLSTGSNVLLCSDSEWASVETCFRTISYIARKASQDGTTRPSRRPRANFIVTKDQSVSQRISQQLIELYQVDIAIYTRPSSDWLQHINKHAVLVTVKDFLASLEDGDIAVSQAALIIFHDVANLCIEKLTTFAHNFYRPTDVISRPVILGMYIASISSQSADPLSEKREQIENLLEAQFPRNTYPSTDSTDAFFGGAKRETVLFCNPVSDRTKTSLTARLQRLDPEGKLLESNMSIVQEISVELGVCAVDLFWQRYFTNNELFKLNNTVANTINMDPPSGMLQIIRNWPFMMPNLDPQSQGFNVSPKFAMLVHTLQTFPLHTDTFCCIIFVHNPQVGFAITDILSRIGHLLPNTRVRFLRGDYPPHPEDESTLKAMHSGGINILIASSSSADLGIPPVHAAICFDLPENQVSYAYVKARVRTAGHIFLLAKRASAKDRWILANLSSLDDEMKHWIDDIDRYGNMWTSLPPAHLGDVFQWYQPQTSCSDGPTIIDPTTSLRIHMGDVTTVVFRVSSRAQRNAKTNEKPLLTVKRHQSDPVAFTCELNLPPSLAMGTLFSDVQKDPANARRDVCFKACLELQQLGLLLPQDFPPACIAGYSQGGNPDDEVGMANLLETSHPKQSASNTRAYSKKIPDFWLNTVPGSMASGSRLLYPMIVGVEDGEGPSFPSLVLLTRQPLPTLSGFRIFLHTGVRHVRLQNAHHIALDEQQMQWLLNYTIRVFRAVTNKPLDCRMEDILYFIMPLSSEWNGKESSDPQDISPYIPWSAVQLAADNVMVHLQSETSVDLQEDLYDAVLQDRWSEFTRRYEVVQVRHDLTPLSKPIDSPREAGYASFLLYCQARQKDFKGIKDDTQPMIEVVKVPPVRDCLRPVNIGQLATDAKVPAAKYLIPELAAKFTIPASVLRTAALLPSITRRIDDMLLIKEFNAKVLSNLVDERLLLPAITCPSAGGEDDYERLELLGDAFLKYMASVYLFVTRPTLPEHLMHVERQRIIANKHLFVNGVRSGLVRFIQSKPLGLKSWTPLGFHVASSPVKNPDEQSQLAESDIQKRNDESTTQMLSDSVVADVTEAVIGAAVVSGGSEAALQVVKMLGTPLPLVHCWSDFGRKCLPSVGRTAQLKEGAIEYFERLIDHKIAKPHVLAHALTHNSITRSYSITCYQRLEFLGDAILEFLMIRHVFHRKDRPPPGVMSMLKTAMGSNRTLAAICVSTGMHKYLLHESPHLEDAIQNYVTTMATTYRVAHSASPQKDAPKPLADMVESILAALYISDDFDPVGVELFYSKILQPFFDQHITLHSLARHPTQLLFELLHASGCHEFDIRKTDGRDNGSVTCSVHVHGNVLATSSNPAYTAAAKQASWSGLEKLERDTDWMMKICDCRSGRNPGKAKAVQKSIQDIINSADESTVNCALESMMGGPPKYR